MAKMAIVAKLTAREGKRDEILAAFDQLFPAVEGEAGTEVYALHKDAGDENILWFYELYTDGDAATAHGQSEAMKATGAALRDLLDGRPDLVFLQPVRAKGISL